MAKRWAQILDLSSRAMAMDDASWRRHANPLSVYSRMTVLPLMTLAVLSRIWLGWGCLLLVALVCLWVWWNPRAFGVPTSTQNWASRATFGERVLLNHKNIAVPDHHMSWAQALGTLAGLGLIPWIYGLWLMDPGFILLGLTLSMGAKLWFVDRMVWLFQDMKAADSTYAAWEY